MAIYSIWAGLAEAFNPIDHQTSSLSLVAVLLIFFVFNPPPTPLSTPLAHFSFLLMELQQLHNNTKTLKIANAFSALAAFWGVSAGRRRLSVTNTHLLYK